MWSFQDSDVKRGGHDEPMAIHTELGWVLSGPFRSKNFDASSIENLVGLVVEPRPLQDKAVSFHVISFQSFKEGVPSTTFAFQGALHQKYNK